MRKLATLCLSVAVGASALFAGMPAKRMASSGTPAHPQGKPIENPFLHLKKAASNEIGIKALNNKKARLPQAVTKALAPAKAGASGSTVYGLLVYDGSETYPKSVYDVYLDGSLQNIFNSEVTGPSGYDFFPSCMYQRDDKFIIIGSEVFWGIFNLGDYMLEYDLEGNLLGTTTYTDSDIMFGIAAYNPTDDILYGYIPTSSAVYFATAPGDAPNQVTVVDEVSDFTNLLAITYNQISGKLIGVADESEGGSVFEMSTADGSQTKVGTLEHPSTYSTGIAYSPYDNGYVYEYTSDIEAGVALLDENTFKELSYTAYDYDLQFMGLYCPDNMKIADNAPAESTLVNTIFGNGALSGSLTYKLATTTHAGTPVIGDIDWILLVDGNEVKRGAAPAGGQVTVNVTDLSEGLHTFTFQASLGGNFGRNLVTTLYIGNDTPAAPEDVTLTATTVSWKAVTTGIHEGYVNAEEVTYNVYLNDEIIAEGIKATECASHVPANEILTGYVASVEAIFDGKVSEMAYSNDLAYGDPFTLPVSFQPTQKESKVFTILDANNDANGIFFSYVNVNGEALPMFIYNYSSSEDADDWLFLPATTYGDTNAVYEFSMNCFKTDDYQENVEVKLFTAPNPESPVSTIIADTELLNGHSSTDELLSSILKGYFSVPNAGVYYVGVHVISPADQYRVYMRDFSVKAVENMTVANPAAATNLSATPGAKGALNAAVTFTLPTTNFNGTAYEADKALKATVQAEGCDLVTANGKPGETLTITVPTKQSENVITVIVYDGEMASIPATVGVYTGTERPGTVENLKGVVDATDYKLHMTWEAPAEGSEGGYVAPTGITYYLCEYLTTSSGTGWYITEEIGTDVFEYDYEIAEGTAQSLVRVGIICSNFIGQADYLLSTSAVMGQPYEIPSVCVATANQVPSPLVSYDDFNLRIGNPAQYYPSFTTTDNVSAIYTYSTKPLTDALFSLPKVSTKTTKNPAITLDIYGGSADFSLVASASGIDWTTVKSYKTTDFATPGRQTIEIELPADFNGKDWIMLGISADISSTASFILYGYKVFDKVPFDFGVTTIEGPSKAQIGSETKFVAHITNFGTEANMMPESTWTLTDAEGNIVANVTVPEGTEAIEPDAELTLDIAFTPTAEQIGDMVVTYTITRADDKETNDSMSKEFTVGKGLTPVITDLSAQEVSFDKVVLEWTPLASTNEIVESFEDETPFILDGTSDMVAQFKRVDGDKKDVYVSQASNFANIPGAGGPSSYLLWSQKQVEEILNSSGTFEAKTGDQFLIAFCPSDASAADDWLISPAVAPGSDISFSVRPITYLYGAEVIEVMYSTTGDAPEDFKVLETIEVSGDPNAQSTTWHDYSLTLPGNVKYFALHYVSEDIFGIMIDDIAYAPADGGAKLVGFDIYRNGSVIASNAPCEDSTYTDATVAEETEYSYIVIPVLSDGTKGIESNVLNVTTTGVEGVIAGSKAIFGTNGMIVVKGYEGKAVSVVSTDGKVVASTANATGNATFNVAAGIYVVKAGKDVVKVIVK